MADDQTTQELTRSIQALQQAMLQGKTVDPKEIDRLDKALKNASRGSKSQSDAQKTQTSGTHHLLRDDVEDLVAAEGGVVEVAPPIARFSAQSEVLGV